MLYTFLSAISRIFVLCPIILYTKKNTQLLGESNLYPVSVLLFFTYTCEENLQCGIKMQITSGCPENWMCCARCFLYAVCIALFLPNLICIHVYITSNKRGSWFALSAPPFFAEKLWTQHCSPNLDLKINTHLLKRLWRGLTLLLLYYFFVSKLSFWGLLKRVSCVTNLGAVFSLSKKYYTYYASEVFFLVRDQNTFWSSFRQGGLRFVLQSLNHTKRCF